jgi:dihydroorotase
MNLLIKSAKIIDPNSKHHNKIMDILIKNGKIEKIAKSINPSKKEVSTKEEIEFSAKNLHLSPGWFDLHANFCEPGFEQSETLLSGSESAAKGGFTNIMIMPNTKPKIDNKGMVKYILDFNRNSIVNLFPAGNVTKNAEGNHLVEMHDMHNAGCLAFTDDKESISRSDVLKIAMLYAKDSNSLIMNFPNDKKISNDGSMNEGKISTLLGIKGIPSIAEELIVDRDITLTEYTNARIHLSYLSTKNSIKKLKEAKKRNLNITADVSINNLFLTEDKVNDFDTRYKTMPPLRTKSDKNALIKGLKEGVIDAITSDHSPVDPENKKIEFNEAKYGLTGLETIFGVLGKYLAPHLSITQIIEKIAINPRKILKLNKMIIQEGEFADITLFDPKLNWTLKKDDIKSKSKNTPFLDEELTGKPLAIYNNGEFQKC